MNQLQVFQNNQFGDIRAIVQNGEPWFVAADVCRALEISNPSVAIGRLDEDEKMTLSSTEGHSGKRGGAQFLNAVNEAGLYTLVLGSRKPEAKQFKRWITHEVLPSIRKTGGYIKDQETMSDTELMAKALMVAQRQIEEKNLLIEQMKPDQIFAGAVCASDDSILMGVLAKMLRQNGVDIGQNRLFQWMRENGYLINRRGADWNMPTQRSMDMGLFEIKETAISHSDGHVTVSRTVKVTGKGQKYFINIFLREKK